MDECPVEIAPFSKGDRVLSGFVVSGRWPATTREWAQLLALAVRLAAVPGMVSTTSVFASTEDRLDEGSPMADAVGLVVMAGPVVGTGALEPGRFHALPSALLLLHPPGESVPSSPEAAGSASGCVLLPGLPHLGLDHRAAWVEAEADGTVTRLESRTCVDPYRDPDTAVLAMFLAA